MAFQISVTWEGTGLRRISLIAIALSRIFRRWSIASAWIIMPDISEAQVLVSLETVANGKTLVGLIMRLTAGRHVSNPIGKRESCWRRTDIGRFAGRNWVSLQHQILQSLQRSRDSRNSIDTVPMLQKNNCDHQCNQEPRPPRRWAAPETRRALPEPRDEALLIWSKVCLARHQ
jgi:hypothetical protein